MSGESLPCAEELRRLVRQYDEVLSQLDDATVHRRPRPGKWSVAEIIGHLVDSASNNHQRFVRGRWQDDLVFPGYDQDAWVTAQGYQNENWRDLLNLWRSFNLHLAQVMERTPADARARSHVRHNLDQVAFRSLPAGMPATLGWFMQDYVEHFKHHLGQIDALLAA